MAAPAKGVPPPVAFVCMALGLVFLGIGVLVGRSAWNRLSGSERVTGTVVELARHGGRSRQNRHRHRLRV